MHWRPSLPYQRRGNGQEELIRAPQMSQYKVHNVGGAFLQLLHDCSYSYQHLQYNTEIVTEAVLHLSWVLYLTKVF